MIKESAKDVKYVKLDEDFVPNILDKNKQVISEETAYQMTSILKVLLKEEQEKN